MHNGKQVTKKPREKVGVPQKKERSEEGVSAPVCRGTKHYSVVRPRGAVRRGHGLTFGVAAPASASQHITSAGTRPSASPRRPAPAPPHRPESP